MTTKRKHQRRLATKRAFDTAAIVAASPVVVPVAALTALAVRVKMGSPVLFTQKRIGLNEKPFTLLKFRSMLPETDKGGNPIPNEQRLTSFGRVLRKSSLDEIPQLLNVLLGDMSLVGPRPLLPEYLPFYTDAERARHTVRPGITGLAQTEGRNGLSWDVRLSLDADYAANASLLVDLKILARTVIGVFTARGVNPDISSTGVFLHHHRDVSAPQLRIRPVTEKDLETRVRWFNDPRMTPTMVFPEKITLEGTKRWFTAVSDDSGREDFTLVHRESGEILGFVGYRPMGNPSVPEVYVAANPDRLGVGLGSAMIQLITDHIGATGRYTGAIGEMFRSNPAVIRSFEKAGYEETDAPDNPERMRMQIRFSSD